MSKCNALIFVKKNFNNIFLFPNIIRNYKSSIQQTSYVNFIYKSNTSPNALVTNFF